MSDNAMTTPTSSSSEIPEIELISFNLCPFVQRSVITLLQKGIHFRITYIDLANKPDWFLAISPTGKVPVVRYGKEVLFESAVINEFLDEVTPQPLMPEAPVAKAKDRAWIEYSSQVLMDQYRLSMATTPEALDERTQVLNSKLEHLESQTSSEGYFSGAELSLVDTALAPLFTRFALIEQHYDRNYLTPYPKLSALGKRLLALESVKLSVVEDFADIYQQYNQDNGSVLAA